MYKVGQAKFPTNLAKGCKAEIVASLQEVLREPIVKDLLSKILDTSTSTKYSTLLYRVKIETDVKGKPVFAVYIQDDTEKTLDYLESFSIDFVLESSGKHS